MTSESIHRFGDARLVGIVTTPSVPRVGAPVVILLNAGFVHRIGPFRMTVALARRLAGRGYHVLRFDQSGLGDSDLRSAPPARLAEASGNLDAPASRGLDSLEARIVADIRDATDFGLAHTGASRAVVMGLCSGAINAHLAAVADARIVGAVLVDGYAYPTPRFYLRHYAPRLVDSRRVAGFAARSARAVLAEAIRRATPPHGVRPTARRKRASTAPRPGIGQDGRGAGASASGSIGSAESSTASGSIGSADASTASGSIGSGDASSSIARAEASAAIGTSAGAVAGASGGAGAAASAAPGSIGGAVYLQELPPRHRIEAELRGLLQRGARMLCIYSGGAGSYFNYPEQLADCFPSLDLADRVRVEHMPEADHTFALAVDRERLFGVIERWMSWWFG